MIKTLIKLQILKFILIVGASAAYAFKRYCDKHNAYKSPTDKKTLPITQSKFLITFLIPFFLLYKLHYIYYIHY